MGPQLGVARFGGATGMLQSTLEQYSQSLFHFKGDMCTCMYSCVLYVCMHMYVYVFILREAIGNSLNTLSAFS